MIKITRFNGEEFVVNCDMIETVEETPDTVITLTNGHKFLAREDADEIIEKVVKFKKLIYSPEVNREKEV